MEGDRGLIKYPELYHKEFNWSDFRYDNITPTDIDFFIEYKNILFIIGEAKYKNSIIPRGQLLALERLVDNLKKPSILIIGEYSEEDYDLENRVILSSCKIREYRYNKKWHTIENYTFKELCDRFIKSVTIKG